MSRSSAGRDPELTGFKTTSVTYPRYFSSLWLPVSIHVHITDSSRIDETNQILFFRVNEKNFFILFGRPPPSGLGEVASEGLLGQRATTETRSVSHVCLRRLRLGRVAYHRRALARSRR